MPRIFHMRTNTAEMIKNVTIEVDNSMKSLLAISNIILEIILVCGIITFLLVVDYRIALTCLIIFFHFFNDHNFFKFKTVNKFRKGKNSSNSRSAQNIIETLTGSKTYQKLQV